jgi:hypothetical protein
MGERPEGPSENPLEDLAAELSETLGSAPVDVENASTDDVRGGQVRMSQSAARTVVASALHMDESAAAVVRTSSLDAHDSSLGVVVARTAVLADVNSSLVVAQKLDAKDVRTVFLAGGDIRGEVRSVFTPLSAAALGAGFALAWWLLRSLVGKVGRARARRRSGSTGPV